MLLHGALSLINLFGFLTGIILYGMLLWMVLSSRPVSNRLVLLTGVFGLTWNLGSFAAYALAGTPLPLLLAVAFGALCFLPAAVVHSALRNGEGWAHPWSRLVVRVAYAMSGAATIIHFYSAVAWGLAPSQLALRGLTVGFGALLLILLFVARGQDGWARGLWVAALAVFAVSALHLSAEHGAEDPWWLALLGHHASLPLVLAILYQDYKFALADLFLKRALSLILLVGLVFGVYTFGAAPLIDAAPRGEISILLLLGMWTATALAYPLLRAGAGWFIDKVVLGRGDYGKMLTDAADAIEHCDSEAAALSKAASILEPVLSCRSVTWTEWTGARAPLSIRNSTQLPVPTTEGPHFSLCIGPLFGGRRLLSDDHAMIERVALLVGRRIDLLRSARERYERNLREEEVRKLAAEAELRALRAQINPHFLFNALTTIGYLIQTAPKKAVETLLTLSGLLRSVLKSSGEFVTLGEELSVVEAYLDIERARFEDRLQVSIDVPPETRGLRIPALILQPLVENAIKHGISRSIAGGTIRIRARAEDTLILTVINTSPDDHGTLFEESGRRGVGLENVQRRLACLGGSDASLSVRSERGEGTVVEIRYPVETTVPAGAARS
jgi:two-component system LytT family sensor kinase